jgi:hypothetical protein
MDISPRLSGLRRRVIHIVVPTGEVNVSNQFSVELWLSYISEDAPPGEADTNKALGWTKEQASARAFHWIPAKWEKFLKITLFDRSTNTPEESDEYLGIMESEFSYLEQKDRKSDDAHGRLTDIEHNALIYFHRGQYASAWLSLFPKSERPDCLRLPQLASRESEAGKQDVPYSVYLELKVAALAYLSAQAWDPHGVVTARENLVRLVMQEMP